MPAPALRSAERVILYFRSILQPQGELHVGGYRNVLPPEMWKLDTTEVLKAEKLLGGKTVSRIELKAIGQCSPKECLGGYRNVLPPEMWKLDTTEVLKAEKLLGGKTVSWIELKAIGQSVPLRSAAGVTDAVMSSLTPGRAGAGVSPH
ncbi:UNVERIFIED_CONTAM: hypothetical protein FKN15_058181 [Acipenser sinensis]